MRIRNYLGKAVFGILILTNGLLSLTVAGITAQDGPLVFVGTYSQGGSEGIYCYRFDPRNGVLSLIGTTINPDNPSFLALHPSGHFLYSADEVSQFGGRKSGAISAYRIDPSSGALTLLNRQASEGTGPCHITIETGGRHLLVANYGGGSIASLPIREDGTLEAAVSAIQHQGSSIDPNRQKGPHAHSIDPVPESDYVLVSDLGLDQVLVYRMEAQTGKLTPNNPPHAALAPGAGPRHLTIDPQRRFVYVINELNSTITAFRFERNSGVLSEIQTVSTLPEEFKETNYTAEIFMRPDGLFLYGSNRGHNSIAAYRVDPENGRLRLLEIEPTRGDWPRNFGIDPTGRYLIAANQKSNQLTVFGIDPQSGTLDYTGVSIDVPSPVCVKFLD